LETDISWDAFRPKFLQGVLGLSPKVTIGVDGLFRGNEVRNVYWGFGASIDLHFGKRILWFDFDRQRHFNGTFHTADTTRAMIGFRIMSIDLKNTTNSRH
jgi:hypothetical protein